MCNRLLAFYYPGRPAPCDELCKAQFLGNFFDARVTLERGRNRYMFENVEAAYQAQKFWPFVKEFQSISGEEAFRLSRQLQWDGKALAREADRLSAMRATLALKFSPGSFLARKLIDTRSTFLLEHNSFTGRDGFWSDNSDGTGKNWLGALLMLQRMDLLKGKEEDHWAEWLLSNVHPESGTLTPDWRKVVGLARNALFEKLRTTSSRLGKPSPEAARISKGPQRQLPAPSAQACNRQKAESPEELGTDVPERVQWWSDASERRSAGSKWQPFAQEIGRKLEEAYQAYQSEKGKGQCSYKIGSDPYTVTFARRPMYQVNDQTGNKRDVIRTCAAAKPEVAADNMCGQQSRPSSTSVASAAAMKSVANSTKPQWKWRSTQVGQGWVSFGADENLKIELARSSKQPDVQITIEGRMGTLSFDALEITRPGRPPLKVQCASKL
ncbi:unnamed protein product [Symbiodinium sp. CCMP2592]|nr:unnamed protein product [Symbiodinium sp. CCMP2592]